MSNNIVLKSSNIPSHLMKYFEEVQDRVSNRNTHPTWAVKPIELNRYLSSLLLPPDYYGNERRILIPFFGSGSEGIGATLAGWPNITGVELTEEYIPIAEQRLKFWSGWAEKGYSDPKEILKIEKKLQKLKKDEEESGQMSMF